MGFLRPRGLIESQLAHLGERRDDVAAQMRALLLGAAFSGRDAEHREGV